MPNRTKKFLSPEALEAVRNAIADVEKKTAGEIRVSVREKRAWSERSLQLEELAAREFRMLGMEKTIGRTGVLVYILLSERQFRIHADEGINQLVMPQVWQEIANRMSALFAAGSFQNGLVECVRAVGEVLAQHVPPVPNDTNELSNDVSIR